MSIDIKAVADAADFIVDGYAYTKDDGTVHVLNLNKPAAVWLTIDGSVLASNTDAIETQIIVDIYEKNKSFLEDDHAEILSV